MSVELSYIHSVMNRQVPRIDSEETSEAPSEGGDGDGDGPNPKAKWSSQG